MATQIPDRDELTSEQRELYDKLVASIRRHEAKQGLAHKVERFCDAAFELLEAWKDAEWSGWNPSDIDGFPFPESFDEMCHRILEWRQNMTEAVQ